MIELTSTPIILLVILGSVGVALPVINIAMKEKGSVSALSLIHI